MDGRTLGWMAFAAITLATAQAPVAARDDGSWVGKRVITRFGTVLRDGGRVVDDEGRRIASPTAGPERRTARIYRVERAEGDRLWLVAEGEGARGWARVDDVLTLDEALAALAEMIRASPEPAEYIERGNILKGMGELDRAIADYTEAIRLDHKCSIAYIDRGRAFHLKGEYDRAIEDYTEAIRLRPHASMAFHNRGDSWRFKGEYDRAIADFNEAIRLDPASATAYNDRGCVWCLKKEYDRALADFNEAIRREPHLAFAYTNRGHVWESRREYGKALADHAEAIRFDPGCHPAYANLAWLRATCPRGEYRDGRAAIELATRACELTGWKLARRLDTLAAAHAEAGDFRMAVRWQTKAIKLLRPDDRESRADYEARRKLYQAKQPYRDDSGTVRTEKK